MSHAPCFPLRSLWANGGAPAAFVRRDQILAQQLESLLHTSDATQRIAGDDAFAALLAAVSWAELLPESTPQHDMEEVPDIRRPRTPGAPLGAGNPGSHAASARADAHVPERSPHAAPALSCSGASTRSQFDTAHEEQMRRPWPSHAPAAVAHAPSAHVPAGDSTAARDDRVDTALGPAEGRRVAPLRTVPDPEHAARVAAILAAAVPAAAQPAVFAAPTDVTHNGGRTAPRETTFVRLDAVIRQLELQRAAARREPRDTADTSVRRTADDFHLARHDETVRARRGVEAFTMSDEGAPPRATGMRGLVERTNVTRAAFIFAGTEYDAATWPEGEQDRMSSLLDDAARRHGVDLEEAGL